MSDVSRHASSEQLAHAAELERRDAVVGGELETIFDLAQRAGTIRGRANEIGEALSRIPGSLAEIDVRRREIDADAERARSELAAAEARVAELETARRLKADQLDRARSESSTAQEQLADAEAQLERLAATERELREQQESLRNEADALPRAAAVVAAEIRSLARVTEAAGAEPGATLGDVEEWGARVRSALFVTRGTLETERERIVVEANALGTAVLGENLGGSSVAVIRRRLEERLG
jgi:chromosome segregation ATPase